MTFGTNWVIYSRMHAAIIVDYDRMVTIATKSAAIKDFTATITTVVATAIEKTFMGD